MKPTQPSATFEVLVEAAERQRRWIRRLCWAGVALVVTATLFVAASPLFVRWQLRQHAWGLQTLSHRGLPDWVPRWVDPWLGRIDLARLHRSPLTLGDLERLGRLPDVESFVFDSTEFSDSNLEKLSQLPKLSSVDFNAVRLESTGLRHLATSPNLKRLNFFDTVLDDSAIESISSCRKLHQLIVTGIADDQLRYLSRLHRLQVLGLINPRLTDDGLRRLPDELPDLRLLLIHHANLSAAALADCARRSKLRTVQLKDMPITDDGILEFKSCPTLQLLSVEGSRVTSAGANELRKSVPTLRVEIK